MHSKLYKAIYSREGFSPDQSIELRVLKSMVFLLYNFGGGEQRGVYLKMIQ